MGLSVLYPIAPASGIRPVLCVWHIQALQGGHRSYTKGKGKGAAGGGMRQCAWYDLPRVGSMIDNLESQV